MRVLDLSWVGLSPSGLSFSSFFLNKTSVALRGCGRWRILLTLGPQNQKILTITQRHHHL